MTGHTKGPWEYRPHKHDDWGVVRGGDVVYTLPAIICQARDPSVTKRDEEKAREAGRDPHEANARLIAAAPELLEALEELYEAVDSAIGLTPERIFKAYTAIAKAKGETE